jgi:hypothetical protein
MDVQGGSRSPALERIGYTASVLSSPDPMANVCHCVCLSACVCHAQASRTGSVSAYMLISPSGRAATACVCYVCFLSICLAKPANRRCARARLKLPGSTEGGRDSRGFGCRLRPCGACATRAGALADRQTDRQLCGACAGSDGLTDRLTGERMDGGIDRQISVQVQQVARIERATTHIRQMGRCC